MDARFSRTKSFLVWSLGLTRRKGHQVVFISVVFHLKTEIISQRLFMFYRHGFMSCISREKIITCYSTERSRQIQSRTLFKVYMHCVKTNGKAVFSLIFLAAQCKH